MLRSCLVPCLVPSRYIATVPRLDHQRREATLPDVDHSTSRSNEVDALIFNFAGLSARPPLDMLVRGANVCSQTSAAGASALALRTVMRFSERGAGWEQLVVVISFSFSPSDPPVAPALFSRLFGPLTFFHLPTLIS